MNKAKLQQLFRRVQNRARDTARYWLRKHMTEFARSVKENALVLDVGGGESPYKVYFPNTRYISIDVDSNKRPDIVANILYLPFKDGIADAVVCTQVLEHVPDPYQALSELKRILKEKAILILSTPLLIGVHAQADFFRYTEQGLKLLVEDCGLEVVKIEKAGGIFSCLCYAIVEMLFYVFRLYNKQAGTVKYGFLFFFYLVLIPVTRLFILLDVLDTRRDYTLAYSLLAKKY